MRDRPAEQAGFEIIHRRFDDLAIYDNNKEARDKVKSASLGAVI